MELDNLFIYMLEGGPASQEDKDRAGERDHRQKRNFDLRALDQIKTYYVNTEVLKVTTNHIQCYLSF